MRVGWALAAAIITAHTIAMVWADATEHRVVLLEEAESSPLDALHTQNANLLQQIENVENGHGGATAAIGPSGPGPEGPSPMAGMMAMGTPSGNGDRMEGIKEALTAVKPIMDKYVNTAKTLTGKYSTLKRAYSKMKKMAHTDPALKGKMDAAMKEVQDEDAKKLNNLENKYEHLQKDDMASKAAANQEELHLKEENQQLASTNQAVAKTFMAELNKARESAKTQLSNMRMELNQFMSDTNKEQYNQLGEATKKAIETKKTLALRTPLLKSEVKKMLEKQAKEDKLKEKEEWGSMEEEDDEGYGGSDE